MNAKLFCGHPIGCLDEANNCKWCEDLTNYARRIGELQACIGKDCIKVTGGTQTITCDSIGLLEVHRGASVKMYAASMGRMKDV